MLDFTRNIKKERSLNGNNGGQDIPPGAGWQEVEGICGHYFYSCFVVRNIKIIEVAKGFFVAMPSRKIKELYPKCGFRNPARNKYCGQCAAVMPVVKVVEDIEQRDRKQSEHRDIVHPITVGRMEKIQKKF
ncbi:MAG: septation protein SpoVG family protein [Candidatus Omnitrophota bacterium]|jgi:stage V sporulation protein G